MEAFKDIEIESESYISQKYAHSKLNEFIKYGSI